MSSVGEIFVNIKTEFIIKGDTKVFEVLDHLHWLTLDGNMVVGGTGHLSVVDEHFLTFSDI